VLVFWGLCDVERWDGGRGEEGNWLALHQKALGLFLPLLYLPHSGGQQLLYLTLLHPPYVYRGGRRGRGVLIHPRRLKTTAGRTAIPDTTTIELD